MTLGDLKKALAKFPPDMHDMEMCINVTRDDKDQYEILCFVAYAEIKDKQTFLLGGESAIQKMIRDGKVDEPKGYIPTSEEGYVEGFDGSTGQEV